MTEQALEETGANRWLLLVGVMVGTFMSVLDNTILNVALPQIMTSFGSDVEQARWVMTGFLLASAVSMPLTNWTGRRIGFGNLFLGCLALFTGGAFISAVSPSMETLIFGRLIQGLAAGVIHPASIAIITRNFPPQMRGRAFGVWSIGVMIAPALGPLFGGVLIDVFGWRSIYIMSVLVGLAAFLVAASTLSRQVEDEPVPFDWYGYLTLITFVVCGIVTVANGQRVGWDSGWILTGFAVTAVSFALFLAVEWDAEHAIVPLHLFRYPDLTLSLVMNAFKSTTWGGTAFLVPIFLFQVQGWSSFQMALLTMPGAVLMALGSPVTGALTDRFKGRWMIVAGTAIMAWGLYEFTQFDLQTGVALILLPQFFRGAGMALINTPVTTTGMNAIPREEAGNASWLLNMSQRVAGAFSISILSTLLHRRTIYHRENLGRSALANLPASQAMLDPTVRLGLSGLETRPNAPLMFSHSIRVASQALAFQNVFFMLALAGALAVIPAWCINVFQRPPRNTD